MEKQAMSKLEERIKYYESRIEFFTECLSGKLGDEERAVYEGKIGCYKTMLTDLQSLSESHREEIEQAYGHGDEDGFNEANSKKRTHESGTEYYEKTYGK